MPDAATTTHEEANAKVIASLKEMLRKPVKRAAPVAPADADAAQKRLVQPRRVAKKVVAANRQAKDTQAAKLILRRHAASSRLAK